VDYVNLELYNESLGSIVNFLAGLVKLALESAFVSKLLRFLRLDY